MSDDKSNSATANNNNNNNNTTGGTGGTGTGGGTGDDGVGWSSAIHEAVWTNNKERVRALVSDPNINLEAVVEDCTPLYLACLKGHTEVAKILIENGRAKVDGDSPPIFAAAGKGNTALVKLLLDFGADPSSFSTQHAGCCALHIAAEKNYVDVVKLLLDQANVDVNVRSVKQQLTPLISASCCGSLDAVSVLLSSGAEIDAQSSTGNTALMLAIDRGKIDVALALIKSNADLEIRGQKGWTALHNAASGGEKGYKEVAEALLSAGASVDALSETMLTPLHEAAGKSLVEIVSLLVEKGANVNARDKFNNTPLRMCASNAQSFATIETFKGTVEILLRAGADVNAGTTINTTSLHSVVKWGNVEAVKFMLDKGAEANIRTSKGELPIDFSKNPDVKNILKPYTKSVEAKGGSGSASSANGRSGSPWNAENWMPDHMANKCGYCQKGFSFIIRKHHCRNCGQIFCADCTGFRAKVPAAKENMARVCSACNQELQQASQSKQGSN